MHVGLKRKCVPQRGGLEGKHRSNRCATYGRPEAEHLDGRVAAIVGRVRAGETLRFAAEWGIEWECRRRRRGVEGWGGV